MDILTIIDTTPENITQFGMCGYKNIKQAGYAVKVEWMKERYEEGMKYKVLYAEGDGAVGAIEYIPGEYAWRPVIAAGYLFIHCLFIIPKKYKGKGYGAMMLEECWNDAIEQGKHGVAVVTRKGTWMAGKELFIKHGFEVADKAPPDFELLVKRNFSDAPLPVFAGDLKKNAAKYPEGLTIFTSGQCPYTTKAVRDIGETAEKEYGIKSRIMELKTASEARKSPCAFGTFCITYNSKLIADHPISSARFRNIMGKLL